jgi:hypothetical protein
MKTAVAPTGLRHPCDALPGRRRKRKSRPGGRLSDTGSYPGSAGDRRGDHIGFLVPSLYVYRVVAAFFSSPFGSNEMFAVMPL